MSSKFNKSYIGKRSDLLDLIPADSKNFLDIGCSIGTLGKQIKDIIPNSNVTGIELSEEMGKVALNILDKVIIGDVENNVMNQLNNNSFDCILLGDIVEHLKDPWSLIKECKRVLKKNGTIIASIPNIRHISTIYNLVIKGYWPYRERGIHDKTHLRFFTIKNIMNLFEDEKLVKEKVIEKYRFIERPHKLNKKAGIIPFILYPLKSFFVFQYIVVYKKIN